jgi:hypothetical protein
MGNSVLSAFGKTAGKSGVASVAASVGASFLKNVINKKGVQTNLKFLVESLFKSHQTRSLPPQAVEAAKLIEELFDRKRLLPDRIAIDGTPGSGKSSLARALAKRLAMRAICYDHQDLDQHHSFMKRAVIYEHHRLLRTQDVDCFDVIIYIDQPVEISRNNILHRERGAYLVDIMNFDLLKRIGLKAFTLAEGSVDSIANCYARVKIKPANGYRVNENLTSELIDAGVDPDRIKKLNKEQQIFRLVEGKAKKGFLAYVNPLAYEEEFLDALAAGLKGTSGNRGNSRR